LVVEPLSGVPAGQLTVNPGRARNSKSRRHGVRVRLDAARWSVTSLQRFAARGVVARAERNACARRYQQ
jgi:hypothetical protein